MVVSAAVWILRWTSPEVRRPFRAPALPLVAALGILINGGLMFSLGRDNWIRLFVWLVLGLVIYFGYSRYHTKLGRPADDRPACDRAARSYPEDGVGSTQPSD